MQSNSNKREVYFAGFFVRLAAYAIDSIIVSGVLIAVRIFTSGFFRLVGGSFFTDGILFHYSFRDIMLYGFHVLYFILQTYYTGTTVGKRLLNLQVISTESRKLSLFDVIYRETVGRFLCGISIGIGYIMIGVDKEKRGIHDLICDTRVVYEKRIRVTPVPRASEPVPVYRPPVQQPIPGPNGLQEQKEDRNSL